MNLTAELAKRPPWSELLGKSESTTLEELGFTVDDLTVDLAGRYGYEGQSGVLVTKVEPGSGAERAGIVAGVLIKEVNGATVKNTKEFNEQILKAKEKGRVLLKVRRERYTFFVLLTLSD